MYSLKQNILSDINDEVVKYFRHLSHPIVLKLSSLIILRFQAKISYTQTTKFGSLQKHFSVSFIPTVTIIKV